MKTKLVILTVAMLFAGATFATVRTVSNTPNSPGQYTSLQAAIDASAVGDTVYIHPSTTSYGQATVLRRINIFGAGYDGRTYQNKTIATVGNITFNKVSNLNTSSGSRIVGLNGGVITVNTDTIRNIIIERCNLVGIIFSANNIGVTAWHIFNNVISSIYLYSTSGNTIENNVTTDITRNNVAGNNLVRNNIIWTSSPLSTSYVTYTNNIFINRSTSTIAVVSTPTATTYHNNNFSNNLFYNYNTPIPQPFNNGGTNVINQDPLFVNAPQFNQAFNMDSVVSYNLRLDAASPGKNFGADGTDIGIYGGNRPWVNPQGLSWLPQVLHLNITNPAVPVGGTLNVTSRGVKRN